MNSDASNSVNNTGNAQQVGGNFDTNNNPVANQRMFASLTSNARHVIARSAHSDTLEVGGYDPELSLKLSIASAQNDNFKNRTSLNKIAKQLLAEYNQEFEMDIENAYYNFKNGLPNIPGLETGVIFMGCEYRGEKLGRLKIYNPQAMNNQDNAVMQDDIENSSQSVEDSCEIIAVLSGDDAKYELRNRAEIYYDSVSRTVPDGILEEYTSEIN